MCNTGLLRFISPFGRFSEDFTLSIRGKYSIFSSSLSSSFYSLSMPLPFTLSLYIPFTSLFLSLLSLPPSLYLSFLLSLSLSPSLSLLSIILFGASNGRFHPCFLKNCFEISLMMKKLPNTTSAPSSLYRLMSESINGSRWPDLVLIRYHVAQPLVVDHSQKYFSLKLIIYLLQAEYTDFFQI